MIFLDEAHNDFFRKIMERTHSQNDPYHLALFYTLGLSDDTRRNIADLYDFAEKGIETEGLYKCWQTSGTLRITRLAFNLYNGWNGESGGELAGYYTPYELFCDGKALYFFEAIKLLYPESFQNP
ncbi:MAG: DUF6075 family protein [Oscillospiraceae bacterium]